MCVVKLMLILMVFFNFTFPASFAPLPSNPYSGKPMVDHSNDNGVVNQSKLAGGGGGGRGGGGGAVGGNGRSAGESNTPSGGQSNSSPRGGGGAVIPIYTAGSGATAQTTNHHNTAARICNMCWKDRLLVIIATTLTSLYLIHVCKISD